RTGAAPPAGGKGGTGGDRPPATLAAPSRRPAAHRTSQFVLEAAGPSPAMVASIPVTAGLALGHVPGSSDRSDVWIRGAQGPGEQATTASGHITGWRDVKTP